MLTAKAVLPASTRPFGGVLASARDLAAAVDGGQWVRGVKFTGDGCIAPIIRDACVDVGAQSDDASRPDLAAAEWHPIEIRQGAECSALGNDPEGQAELAGRRLDATREWAVGRMLQVGLASSPNPNFTDDAAVVASAVSPSEGLACLDQEAANALYGMPAVIHASPLLAGHLLAANVLWRDGTRWRTAAGSIVIVSPGYFGVSLFATAEVFAASGFRTPLSGVERTQNTLTAWADEVALAVFDPCWIGEAATTVTDCAGST
jgi:hypothetical protein